MGVAHGPRIRTSEVRSATGVMLPGVCGAPWGVWGSVGYVVLPGVCGAPWSVWGSLDHVLLLGD